jgi:hypothetical protein
MLAPVVELMLPGPIRLQLTVPDAPVAAKLTAPLPAYSAMVGGVTVSGTAAGSTVIVAVTLFAPEVAVRVADVAEVTELGGD